MVRFWDCAIPSCGRAAALDIGVCEQCHATFCAAHIRSALHTCKDEPLDDDAWEMAQTTELAALHGKIDEDALVRRASELAHGRQCRLDTQDPTGRNAMGGMHVHREIVFDDGSVWLARILRENRTSFANELSNQILQSECATLVWLKQVEGVPAPRLHGFGLRGDPDNTVGDVAYMLIDKLPGRPFDSQTATASQRQTVLEQWAGILQALSRHPLDRIGSLQFSASQGWQGMADIGTTTRVQTSVGPLASDRTGTLPCIGPFDRAENYLHTWASTYRDLVMDGQLCAPYRNEAIRMWSHIMDRTHAWLKRWSPDLHTAPFFLKHGDDKGDHILVDSDHNITGVIDWTFARSVPAYEAFGPSLLTANLGHLLTGTLGLGEDDVFLGRELCQQSAPYCFFDDDAMRRLSFGLGMGFGLSRDETIPVFNCLVNTFGDKLDENRQQLVVPRFSTCSVGTCARPAVRSRFCRVCLRHLCSVHALRTLHNCPPASPMTDAAWEADRDREIASLLSQLNVAALERHASILHDGIGCTWTPSSPPLMGCANYHGHLLFNDGVRWLVRIPRTTTLGEDTPLALVDYLIKSEYGTLRFLEGIEKIPTARAYAYGLFGDPTNAVGVGYILQDTMPGQPFDAVTATAEDKALVYRQYADILVAISENPLPKACSLVPKDDNETVEASAIASDRFVRLGEHGPFASALDYFSSVADLHMDLIADGQLFPAYPKEAFLFYHLLRSRVSPLLASESDTSSISLDTFFLKHVDDKGDHLLVDDRFNITAVIDWQFARFVPACEAFGPSLFSADLHALYSGSALEPSRDDLLLADALAAAGRPDLATIARTPSLARRFCMGLESGHTREDALSILSSVLTKLELINGIDDLEGWIQREWEGLDDERCDKIRLLSEMI